MSDEIFWSNVRAPSFPYQYSMNPMNSIHQNASGTVRDSFSHSDHDWMRYSIQMNLLSDAQRTAVINFLRAMGGNLSNFLFQDLYGVGYSVARNSLGTGDGSEAHFQLREVVTVGSTTKYYDRWDIINDGTLQVWVNNVLQTYTTHYTCDFTSSGLITFEAGAIPGAGHAVEAAFGYYRRCRFTGSLEGIMSAYASHDIALTLAEEGI